MIEFTATILKFGEQGEKTGWSYIPVPADLAQELLPDNKKAFRVKGKLDAFSFEQASLIPMGGGDFILAFNAAMRKGTGKRAGAMIQVRMVLDKQELNIPEDFKDCLEEDEPAKAFYNALPKSHQRYWINWINSVKSPQARDSRLVRAITALAQGHGFAEMLRAEKKAKER